MFRHCVPVLYVYLFCSSVYPGALAEQPWEQRVKQLESGYQKVSELLEQCTSKVDDMREEITGIKEGTKSDIDHFTAEVTRKVADIKESSVSMADIGITFTRWGRNTCPLGEELIYNGIMSGAYYDHGAGANYECMPLVPNYSNYASGIHQHGLMYGAEFNGVADTVYDQINLEGNTFINQNVPCAQCYATNRTSVHMFPATTDCPSGWTREYWGYLVSAHFEHRTTMYECMDNAPEVVFNGEAGQVGAELYNVEVQCGPGYVFQCGDYISEYELSCVVCTK